MTQIWRHDGFSGAVSSREYRFDLFVRESIQSDFWLADDADYSPLGRYGFGMRGKEENQSHAQGGESIWNRRK